MDIHVTRAHIPKLTPPANRGSLMGAYSDGVRRVEFSQKAEQHASDISEDEWRSKWDQGDVRGRWDRLSSCIGQATADSFPKVACDTAEYEHMRQ
eukprot:9437384-Pyramimonas_sp.AAC.1